MLLGELIDHSSEMINPKEDFEASLIHVAADGAPFIYIKVNVDDGDRGMIMTTEFLAGNGLEDSKMVKEILEQVLATWPDED